MPNILVTPEVFLDLFILCLYWQSADRADLNARWTTVDKMARIMQALGIITEKQRFSLYKDVRAQRIFRMKLEENYELSASLLGASRKFLVMRRDFQENFNYARLLRDRHLYLTDSGRQYALLLERKDKYHAVVTREQYLDENQQQNEMFERLREQTKLAIREGYRQRVSNETGSRDDNE